MNSFEKKFAYFLSSNKVDCQHLIFAQICHSVEEAARTANAKVEDFVKNICLLNENSDLIVCIIAGEKRLDLKKVVQLTGFKKLRFATGLEILEKTGYPVGGTPSFGFDAQFFIDQTVFEHDLVYSGGGSEFSLVKISPSEIKRINNAVQTDLTK
ncbi:MAG: YbaK/EbsC family protein [Candidatus Diapherotrites archaeon]|nr:YbaK/EbsC family protein [Candidatus Diapherotrites archaeon]